MVSSSGTCEIVEESDSVPHLKETKFGTGGSISNHKSKDPSTTGRKFSLEDDLNHIFEAIDLRVSTRGLGLSHRSHTSPNVASKNPIRVGVSQALGIGISESVTLKQALRKISISNASEIAAKKRLLKSIASSEVSKAGTIKRLYRAVVVEASESGIHLDEEKGSAKEVPIVPEEITPDSSYDMPSLLAEAGNKTSTVNLGPNVNLRSALSLSSSEAPMNASEVDQDGSVSLDFVSGTSTLDPYPNVKLHCLPSLSSSDTSNKVSKSTTNSPSLLKPIFGSNCFYKKKVKQNLASVISTYPCNEDDKFGLNPCTSKLACKSHSCCQQDREESISPAPSSTSLIVEGCSSNADSVANKPDIMSNSCMDRTTDAEACKSSRSREKGDSSQTSKSSIGECSGTSGEEANSSRSSYLSTRPHMSKNLRWDVIHNIEIQHGTLGLRHFKLLKRLGCGDIGTVYLAELTGTSNLFAVKVMDTKFLASRKKMLRALTERDILQMLDHPFLPTLFANFVTDKFLCLVMEYCPGGDLHILRQRQPGGNFSEKAARFYVAEVLLALEYLHMLGIVYRDLKPENILVREDGHIMLSDFDLSLRCTVRPTLLKTSSSATEQTRKVSGPCMESSCIHPFCLQPSCVPVRCFTLKSTAPKTQKLKSVSPVHFPQLVAEPTNARSNSFVGTHEYLAPEIIKGEGHGNAVDWWTFGIFLYELIYGKTPFKGLGNEDTLVNVVLHSLKFPTSPSVSSQARDLIRGLLIKDPEIRLGSVKGAAEIRQHPFFEGLNWALIRCAVPPILPKPKFLYPGLSQVCEEKPVEFLSSKDQSQFEQF